MSTLCAHVGTRKDPTKACRYRAKYGDWCGHHVGAYVSSQHLGTALEVLRQQVERLAAQMGRERVWRVASREGCEEQVIALIGDLVGTSPTERPWWQRSPKPNPMPTEPEVQKVITWERDGSILGMRPVFA